MKIDIKKDNKKIATVAINDKIIEGWPGEEIQCLANAVFWEKCVNMLIPGEINYNPWIKSDRIKEEIKFYRKKLSMEN
jgi:hypothetical protein